MEILIINYHYVNNKEFRLGGIYPIKPSVLEKQIQNIKKKYTFISASELETLDIDGKYCLLTFDDGLADHYNYVLPILHREKIPAMFFVNTLQYTKKNNYILPVHKWHLLRAFIPKEEQDLSFQIAINNLGINKIEVEDSKVRSQYRYDNIETARQKYITNFLLTTEQNDSITNYLFNRYADTIDFDNFYMSSQQLKELAEYNFLGLHGHSHIPLSSISEQKLNFEVKLNRDILKDITGKELKYISYPYGGKTSISDNVINYCKKNKIKLGFTMFRNLNSPLMKNKLLLGRFDVTDIFKGEKFINE